MRGNRFFMTTAGITVFALIAIADAQVTMTPKEVVENQGPTAHIVSKLPEDFSGQRIEMLKLFAEDPEVLKALKQYVIADLAHDTESFAINRRQVTTINVIGYVVCVVVHIILGVGLWAAWSEFTAAKRMRKKEPPTTEIELKAQGVALKTSLHGMVLLALAFAFYVLFLTLVYPTVVL